MLITIYLSLRGNPPNLLDKINRRNRRRMKGVQVRKAVPPDAAGIVRVLEAVTAERIHSAIDQVWTVEHETRYLESLAPREVFHVAVDAAAGIVGFQSLDLWSSLLLRWLTSVKSGRFCCQGGEGWALAGSCGAPPKLSRVRQATGSWLFRFARRTRSRKRSIVGSASGNVDD